METERSYKKESLKSSPSGIRFNLLQEKVAFSKSGLKTRQKLVDFLLNKYVNGEDFFSEVKYSPVTEKSYDGSSTNKLKSDESAMFSEPINMGKVYQNLVDNFKGDNEDGEILMRKILAEPTLGKWQRESLQKQLNSKAQ